MRITLLKNLFIVYLMLSTLGASDAFSQKIKIKKTRGLSAVIESSVPLEEGQIYELAVEPISQNVDYKTSGFRSRQNFISVGGNLVSLKGDDYQKTAVALQARYGWNFTNIEAGPVAQFSSDDLGAGATTEFTGGGFFTYNLVGNRDPKSHVYGLLGLVTFGSRQFAASNGGGSATTMDLNAGGYYSWFLNSSSTALRLEGFFDYQQITTTVKLTNVTGFGSRALLIFYF